MNANTISGFINGTKRGQIPVATISAVETAVQVTTDTGTTAAILAVPTQTAILGSSNGLGPNGNAAILVQPFGVVNNTPDGNNAPYYNSSSFDFGHPFTIRVTGTCATGAGGTVSLKLYLGASAAILGTTTAVVSSTTLPISTTGNFIFTTQIRWDSVAAAVAGSFTSQVANAAPVAAGFLSNAVAAASPANLSFLLSVLSAAGSGTVQISEFSLEVI
jgi:hypothetical protein